MATDLHAMLTRHPCLVQAFGIYVVFGPGKARHDDHTLAIYETAGFRSAQADQAAAVVFTFVLGNTLGPAAAASLARKLSRKGGNAEELIRDTMAKASEITAQFPRLRARLGTAAANYGATPENMLEFGLEAILDGLEAQLGARRAPAEDKARRPPSHSRRQQATRFASRSRIPRSPTTEAITGTDDRDDRKGLRDEEIAAALVLSQHTVHRHVSNIYAKLGCSTRAPRSRRQAGSAC